MINFGFSVKSPWILAQLFAILEQTNIDQLLNYLLVVWNMATYKVNIARF